MGDGEDASVDGDGQTSRYLQLRPSQRTISQVLGRERLTKTISRLTASEKNNLVEDLKNFEQISQRRKISLSSVDLVLGNRLNLLRRNCV